ncbi:type II toxin-antitoxin system PemK/MazF family toxin [Candidatus Kaiserbacteria bacterium]|nr:type II toxin-antitoxin system PemK/MazF family toxin [Candidatus Kaiserbacteria bacterium]
MKRGDIVTVAFSGDYGKPRPAVIVQSDLFNDTHATILVCPFTSSAVSSSIFRISVSLSAENELRVLSRIMVDKIAPIRREKIGKKIGTLDGETLLQLNRSLALFVGLIS